MKAILWDGYKQLNGEIIFAKSDLEFKLDDFITTSLRFIIPFHSIAEISYYKLFGITKGGIMIITHSGQKNIFITEKSKQLKTEIELRLK